jgi:hypothetical protein
MLKNWDTHYIRDRRQFEQITLIYARYAVLNFYSVPIEYSYCWDKWNCFLLEQGYKYGMSQLRKYKSGK